MSHTNTQELTCIADKGQIQPNHKLTRALEVCIVVYQGCRDKLRASTHTAHVYLGVLSVGLTGTDITASTTTGSEDLNVLYQGSQCSDSEF